MCLPFACFFFFCTYTFFYCDEQFYVNGYIYVIFFSASYFFRCSRILSLPFPSKATSERLTVEGKYCLSTLHSGQVAVASPLQAQVGAGAAGQVSSGTVRCQIRSCGCRGVCHPGKQ